MPERVYHALKDRISSPIAGPIMLTWLIYNWKIVIVALSSGMTADNKINQILELFNYGTGVWWPVAIGLFYIFVMPLLLVQFGKFENICSRLAFQRDERNRILMNMITEFHYNGPLEMNLALLENLRNLKVSLIKIIDKQNLVTGYLVNTPGNGMQTARHVIISLEEEITKIDITFEENENVTSLINDAIKIGFSPLQKLSRLYNSLRRVLRLEH